MSETVTVPPTHNTVKRVANKVCRVCADKAHGFNFNVVSCESCKAFFRRWALANKQLKCPYDDRCEVTTQSRRMCKKCRMRKCFDVGMSTSTFAQNGGVLSGEQSAMTTPATTLATTVGHKRSLTPPPNDPPAVTVKRGPDMMAHDPLTMGTSAAILQAQQQMLDQLNRIPQTPVFGNLTSLSSNAQHLYHQLTSNTMQALDSNPMHPFNQSAPLPPPHLTNEQTAAQAIAGRVPFLNGGSACGNAANGSTKCTCHCTCGIFPHDMKYTDVIETVSKEIKALKESPNAMHQYTMSPTLDFLNYSINCQLSTAIPTHDHSRSDRPEPRPLPPRPTWLTTEVGRMDEIMSALVWMNNPPQPPQELSETAMDGDGMPIMDQTAMLKMLDHSIKRLIDLAKHFTAFSSLPQEDQMTLLKGGTMEMQMLKGAMNYDHVREGFVPTMPEMNRRFIPIEVLKRFSMKMYDHHKRFLSTFDPKMLSDQILMVILMVITLMNPTRRFLQRAEAVAAEREKYQDMLQRHLQHKYDSSVRSRYLYHVLMSKIEELSEAKANAITFFTSVDTNAIEPLLLEIFDLR